MTTTNPKSQAIINRDAKPRVLTDAHLVRGPLYEAVGTLEIAAADTDASIFRFVRLRSSDRVSTVHVFSDAITGGTSFDVGLYHTLADGSAVVSAALFGSALDLSSASGVSGTDATFEATITNIALIEKRIWELLGLATDPQIEYDLALTANTVGTAAGTVSVKVRYCAGN
jgi:hypothetical protein